MTTSLTLTLDEACEFIVDCLHKTAPFQESGYPMIRTPNIGKGRLILDGVFRVSEETYETWTQRAVPEPGDLILAREAPAGNVALVTEGQRVCLGQRTVHLRPKSAIVDGGYLCNLLLTPEYQGKILAGETGATARHVNLKDIRRLKLENLPRIAVQRRIADILSGYDDLIENNRRRMALLEESARQLYQEWFVRLRFPGHEHTRITNGVPEGWEQRSMEEVAEFRLGKMLDEQKNKGDLLPYLANVNVRWGKIDLENLREMRFEESELDAFGLKFGDIVMCEGGEPGRCAIWKNQLPGMMIQKAIHRIRSRQNVNHVYLYYSLRHKGESGQLATLFTGATIKHLPREKLALVKIAIPPSRLTDLFAEHVGPIENQIQVLEAANRRVSEARDLLLPRLMSGEVAV